MINIIHIKEALNLKVHITQKGGCFVSATTHGKTFNVNEIQETHKIQASLGAHMSTHLSAHTYLGAHLNAHISLGAHTSACMFAFLTWAPH